jgi:hypothetical protein
MSSPDARTLLDAWDGGALLPVFERGPWLVDRLGLAPAGVEAADLTVGACDLLLVELRAQLFGPTVEAVATCAGCGDDTEWHLRLDDIWPHRSARPLQPDDAGEVEVEVDGRRLRCRCPSNRDLAELARIEPAHRPAAFVERCVLGPVNAAAGAMTFDQGSVDDVVASLATALADHDPGAAALVELRCPCGASNVEELDMRTFLWSELSVWAEHTLTEIHQLASSYGWGEPDILAIPRRRRRAYLERCGW